MSNSSPINSDDNNKMILSGEGIVTVVPDTAMLRLGVQTIGGSLADIQEENAMLIQDVVESLEQLGITDIKTAQYEISRYFEYEDGSRIDRGYSVRNILEIRTNQMNQVGVLIDSAVRQGANVVELIQFEVSESSNYYLQALNLAILNAYEKAQSIMEGLGLTVDPIPIRITENTAMPVPFQPIALREAMPVTPIKTGTSQIAASVTIEFVY